MILQQTLNRREKIFATFAVLFLVGLVIFGYFKTVASPLRASVLHANAIDKKNVVHYEELTNNFNKVREDIGTLKSIEIKVKIRALKECLLDAQQSQVNGKSTSAADAYTSCEKLFIEAETQIQSHTNAVIQLESEIKNLENSVSDYGVVVNDALEQLKKKEAASLGKVGH